jgi:8-oxo-dGTP diphosphatase
MPQSASAIIIRPADNKVFATKRSKNKKYSPGKWETVGGTIESGETPEQGLAREVKEELNVGIRQAKPLGTYQWEDRIFHSFIVELDSEPKPNTDDFDDWGWFTKEEIEQMDFAINCKDKILDYYKTIKTAKCN